jgi:hypothetical protein
LLLYLESTISIFLILGNPNMVILLPLHIYQGAC